MSSRRLLKAAQAVRQVIGMAILTDLRDPRVQNVTVTRVEMAPDMREAKVYVSIMGDTAQQNLALHGLQSARGFLQSKLAERIETRYIPRLHFILDLGVKRSLEVARILRDVLPENRTEADNAMLREVGADEAELREEDSPAGERSEVEPSAPEHANADSSSGGAVSPAPPDASAPPPARRPLGDPEHPV